MKHLSLIILIATTLICCKKDDTRNSIIGYWQCEEFNEQSGFVRYQMSIYPNPNDSTSFVFSNFHNIGDTEDKYIVFFVKSDSIVIPQQTIRDIAIKEGKGVVEPDFKQINLTYTLQNPSEITFEASLY